LTDRLIVSRVDTMLCAVSSLTMLVRRKIHVQWTVVDPT